jgi:hypothetical protein
MLLTCTFHNIKFFFYTIEMTEATLTLRQRGPVSESNAKRAAASSDECRCRYAVSEKRLPLRKRFLALGTWPI